MPWHGKPKWNGKEVNLGPLEDKFFPVVNDSPFLVQLENCDNYFLPVFSDKEKLDAVMQHFLKKLNVPSLPYEVAQIKDRKVIAFFLDNGVRIMCDPRIIDEHHTKWFELIKKGDQYKYLDQERN